MIVVWSIFYGFEIHKGWTTENLFLQTIFCTIFFLNALVSVPHYESKEITYRLLNSKAVDLYEGIHFFPLLGLWGQIYTPPEYKTEEKSFIHFDSRQVIRKREINSRLEDFLISLIFPMFRRFEAWNFVLCILLGLGLSWCSIKINQTFFNQKVETVHQYVPQQQPQVSQNQTSIIDKATRDLDSVKKEIDNANKYRSDTSAVIYHLSEKIYSNIHYYLEGKEIIFFPHLIFRDKEIARGLMIPKGKDLKLKGYNSDGSFRILDKNGNELDEKGHFIIWFSYKGKFFSSLDMQHPGFRPCPDSRWCDDVQISLGTPDNVYVVYGKKFNFDGSPYQE